MRIGKVEKKTISGKETLFFQTLEGHIKDSLKIFKAFLDSQSEDIKRFCCKWGLDRQHFIKNLFLTIYLHDLGKLTEEFQRNISQGKHSQRYPHAFFSMGLILALYRQRLIEPILKDDDLPIEVCSILSHHTQLYDELYDEVKTLPQFLDKDVLEFLGDILLVYTGLGFDNYFPLSWNRLNPVELFYFRRSTKTYFSWLISIKNNLLKVRSSLVKNKIRLKAVYCYFTSVLKLCDCYSSSHFHEFIKDYEGGERCFGSVLQNGEAYVLNLHLLSSEQILKGNTPYPFQTYFVNDQQKYTLLLAPCGRGKTEAALIWAQNFCQKTGRSKIIFAMPTQITSNALRKRLSDLYNKNGLDGNLFVGLFHGRSFIKLKEERREEQESDELTKEDLDEISGENFKGNIFYKPITVTTIDHLIYSFVHGFSQADFTLGNLQKAVVVFDEIHYYEMHTLELLLTLFKILEEMDIPYLLMSGTLPEFFIKGVKNVNPDCFGPVLDEEGLKFEPFKLEIHREALVQDNQVNGDVVKKIIENYGKGLSQFIILNTVRRSQQVYKELKKALEKEYDEPNIILCNSQFTYKDRVAKEKDIMYKVKKKPFILVATQVIEISLDISCDMMYTELAPPDAIGQRGGRLNRKRKTWRTRDLEHIMHTFLPEELLSEERRERPYDFDLLQATKKVMKSGVYSYARLKGICDTVYSDLVLNRDKRLEDIFRECSIFGYSPRDITFGTEEEGKLLTIREERYQRIDVIPRCYYGDDESLNVENQVKIPLWWYKADLEKNNGVLTCFQIVIKKSKYREKSYIICNITYNKELGFDYDRIGECSFIDGNII